MIQNNNPALYITSWMVISDPKIEQQFQFDQLSKWRLPIISTLSLLVLINILMFIADDYYDNDAARQPHLLLFRLFLLFTVSSFLIFFLRYKNHPHTMRYLKMFLGIYLFALWIFIFNRPHLGFIEPVVQIVVIFVIYAITPLSWQTQISYAFIWSVTGMLGWYFKIGIEWSFYSILSWQLLAHIMGAFIARNLHFFTRAYYLDQLKLSEQVKTEQTLRSQLSDLIDLLTHELRNPLANIETQARLIERTSEQRSTQLMANKIVHSAHLSADIIAAWVDRAWQHQAVTPHLLTEHHLIALIQQSHEQLVLRYPSFKIHIEQPNSLPPVCIEPKILRLIFSNLLENAAKYAQSDRPLRVHFRQSVNRLTIRLRDYGQGITIDDQLMIFSKHYRANPKSQTGYGVGLYLVREMLEQCHGSIRVQSRIGYGSAFIVELPID